MIKKLIPIRTDKKILEGTIVYSDSTKNFMNNFNPKIRNSPQSLIKIAKRLKDVTDDENKKNEYDQIIFELSKKVEESKSTEEINLENLLKSSVGKTLYDFLDGLSPNTYISIDGDKCFSGLVKQVPWYLSKYIIEVINYDDFTQTFAIKIFNQRK